MQLISKLPSSKCSSLESNLTKIHWLWSVNQADLQRPCGEPVNEKLLNLFPDTVDLSHALILLISEKKSPVQPLCWSPAATTGPWP